MTQQKEKLFKRIEEQEIAAKNFGFYWEHLDQLIEQIRNECLEIKEASEINDLNHLQEEVGDLMQAAVSLAIFCHMDPHDTLLKSVDKFQKRYDELVSLAQQDGLNNLKGKSYEVLLNYWKRAKMNTKKSGKEQT